MRRDVELRNARGGKAGRRELLAGRLAVNPLLSLTIRFLILSRSSKGPDPSSDSSLSELESLELSSSLSLCLPFATSDLWAGGASSSEEESLELLLDEDAGGVGAETCFLVPFVALIAMVSRS